jgi:hypothetical protein
LTELEIPMLVRAFTTVCVISPLLASKLESPLYAAVIRCSPNTNLLAVHVAVPFDCIGAFGHRVLEASATNEIVPVALPWPGAFTITVALRATEAPVGAGFGAAARAVVVEAGFTVCPKVGETLPAFFASPE